MHASLNDADAGCVMLAAYAQLFSELLMQWLTAPGGLSRDDALAVLPSILDALQAVGALVQTSKALDWSLLRSVRVSAEDHQLCILHNDVRIAAMAIHPPSNACMMKECIAALIPLVFNAILEWHVFPLSKSPTVRYWRDVLVDWKPRKLTSELSLDPVRRSLYAGSPGIHYVVPKSVQPIQSCTEAPMLLSVRNTPESLRAHQHITLLQSVVYNPVKAPGPPCHTQLKTWNFYAHDDVTLSAWISEILSVHDHACKQCARPMRDHCQLFASGSATIWVTVESQTKNHPAWMWTECTSCGLSQPNTVINEQDLSGYSAAKFLQHLLYSKELPTCKCDGTGRKLLRLLTAPHRLSTDRRSLVEYCIPMQTHVVRFRYEPLELYGTVVKHPSAVILLIDPAKTLQRIEKAVARYTGNLESYYKDIKSVMKKMDGMEPLLDFKIFMKQQMQIKDVLAKHLQATKTELTSSAAPTTPTQAMVMLNALRRSLHDLMAHTDKTVLAWLAEKKMPIPVYPAVSDPQGYWRHHKDPNEITLDLQQPTSLVSFMLNSNAVGDMMDMLAHVHSTSDRILNSDEVQQAWSAYVYPLSITTTGASGNKQMTATLIHGSHILCMYTDGTGLEMEVTLYHAYGFDRLRHYLGWTRRAFVECLRSCSHWKPTGGKSASKFFTTSDDKLIVKQIGLRRRQRISLLRPLSSQAPPSNDQGDDDVVADDTERRMVLEMVPRYLDYVLHLSPQEPSLLVKTLGVFQMRFRHTAVASTWEDMHVVLMENMFHGRHITSKFDLKGIQTRAAGTLSVQPQSSSASSHLTTLQTPDQTLWDADFLHAIHRQSSRSILHPPQKVGHRLSKAFSGLSMPLASATNPTTPATSLYLHPQAKLHMYRALERDTLFLRDMNIIDYSLLVGIDEEQGELVMGIVDYFGAYDMWKRLENHGKTTWQVLRQSTASLSSKLSLSTDPMVSSSTSWMDIGGWWSKTGSYGRLLDKPLPATPQRMEQAEVTVQPPQKYQHRFMRSMDQYFLMVPDTFTQPQCFFT